jgi:hypothetical protein
MYGRFAIGIALALGLVALASTEVSAQRRYRSPGVVYGYYAAPPTMLPPITSYAPPPVTYYDVPPAAYYAAPPIFTESSSAPRDLPPQSPGYQGSWRNSRF